MGKHIGLIGGIGPAATVVYYRTLVRLHAAASQPLALTIAHADLGTLSANLEAGRAHAQAALFARHVALLRAGGCDLVAVTSMGGHFCRRELDALSVLPVIDAVAALGAHVAAAGIARIGVFGDADRDGVAALRPLRHRRDRPGGGRGRAGRRRLHGPGAGRRRDGGASRPARRRRSSPVEQFTAPGRAAL